MGEVVSLNHRGGGDGSVCDVCGVVAGRRCDHCSNDVRIVESAGSGSAVSAAWRPVAGRFGLFSKDLQRQIQLLLLTDGEVRDLVASKLSQPDSSRNRSTVSFSREDKGQMFTRRQEGQSLVAIADEFGTSYQTVSAVIKEYEATKYWAEMQKLRGEVKGSSPSADTYKSTHSTKRD